MITEKEILFIGEADLMIKLFLTKSFRNLYY